MDTLRDRYLNPFTDFGFKKIFGTELNKDLLIDFLNEVIRERGRITDVNYRVTEQLGIMEADRRAIFDIYCQSESGERFIVELQKAKQNYFRDRSIYYATFPIQEQAQKGEWDYRLDPVYMVGVLDFVFNDEHRDKTVVTEVRLMDTRTREVFYDKLAFIYLQMPNFTKVEEQLETHFDKWLYVLKHLPDLQERPARLQERVFARLFEIAEIAKFTAEERHAYEDSLKHYRDLKNTIDTAREEGRAEGEQIGLEKGRAQGEHDGIKMGKIEVARALLSRGMNEAEISRLTGLPQEEIERIAKGR
ncbi:MAG: Rpn family recombination-promoting nuclease/putative transposase [Acidobacteriota bacterium]